MAVDESEMKIILNSRLFQGIPPEEVEALFPSLRPRRLTFEKDAAILNSGEEVRNLALVLSGIVHVVKEDLWGKRALLSGLLPGDIFAEAYALLPGVSLKTSVLAAAPETAILFLEIGNDERLLRNLLSILARKNLILSRRAEILSNRTIRGRLLSYLSAEAFLRGSTTFDIPFSRQELADHLSVNRSALSNEISKLRQEGIIKCRCRKFVVVSPLEGQASPKSGSE